MMTMMAVSFSNNFPRLSFSIFAPTTLSNAQLLQQQQQQQFKTLVAPQSHHRRLLHSKNPHGLGFFSLSNSFPFHYTNYRRPSFSSSLTLHDSAPEINDEDEGLPPDPKISESEADPRLTSNLKTLINVYKEAILDGDEKTVSEVEAMICIVEKEKNELVQKLLAISEEKNSGKEKYVRLQADFDNFRKRSEKERLTIRSDAQGEVIESLLPMVDSFERAKQQLNPETEMEKKIDTSYQGIYKQFVEIMRSLRVAVVPTVGKPFDPSVHEAIAREESPEFKEGIVIQEIRRGFLLGDRLLRPAMVKVSTGPGKKKSAAATEKSIGQPATAAGLDER